MYEGYFGLTERPFSIAPDPQYLYMSSRHKEAMAHLSYGLLQGGCFIVLTGEVGTGKTTLCRNLLGDLPDNVDVALILNANINETELLQTICDELKVEYAAPCSQKKLLDAINRHLMNAFADNRRTVVIIDEAQLLSRDVLEQIRLLTNLETTKSKLLQIILIGQPELNDVLLRNDLRQLAQRVTARYHLGALERYEIEEYVNYRLRVAGCRQPLFSRQGLNKLHALTGGIPRKINVLADHALLAAYAQTQLLVSAKTVTKAAKDVFIDSARVTKPAFSNKRWWFFVCLFLLLNAVFWLLFMVNDSAPTVKLPETEAGIETRVPAASIVNGAEINTARDEAVSVEQKNVSETGTALTTIQMDDDIEPGTVTIAREHLNDSPFERTVERIGEHTDERAEAEASLQFDDTELGKTLEVSADLTGRVAVFRHLAAQWQVDLPDQMLQPVCTVLNTEGMQCLNISSWRQMIRFNRPTIVVLKHQGQLHRALVQKLRTDIVTLRVGDKTLRVPVTEVQARWTEQAVTLWRPGNTGYLYSKPGDRHDTLPNTRLQLNQALGLAGLPLLNNIDSTEFDLDMSQKVFALQTRFGISSDSQIGYETHLLMNEIIAMDTTPVLFPRVVL